MDLEQRLARLERANRRMKRIGALVLVVAGAVVLSGAAQGKDLPHLEVASLTVKDQDGDVRARLSPLETGASLNLYDKGGKTQAEFRTVADVGSGLILAGKDGVQATLTVGAGSSALRLRDKGGKLRAELAAAADGSPALALFDKAGGLRAVLDVDADGSLFLYDKDGKVRAGLTVLGDGSPSLLLFDKEETPRAVLDTGTTKTAAGTLTLYDAKGDVIWQAPR